jgi:hypothetical protein
LLRVISGGCFAAILLGVVFSQWMLCHRSFINLVGSFCVDVYFLVAVRSVLEGLSLSPFLSVLLSFRFLTTLSVVLYPALKDPL